MEIHLGIEEQDREKIAEGLSRLLADTYTLYLKTQFPLERNRSDVSNLALNV